LNINEESSLVRRWPKLCECWNISLVHPSDIFDALAEHIPLEELRSVFFTDERLLGTFAELGAARLPGVSFWVGTENHLEDVLDRRRLYQFISERGLASVPRTVPNSENPVATFGPEYHIRVWRSWSGVKKLPRGVNIHNSKDLKAWLSCCEQHRLGQDEWGYQELLSTRPEHNVSVCGWHEREFKYYVATRKVQVSNQIGWLVERVDGFRELKERTHAILSALDFSGPFEMEFLLDPKTGDYKVNELNPRFWMQHRLAAAVSHNCLVRRYLSLPIGQSGEQSSRAKRFWMDTDQFLDRLISRKGHNFIKHLQRAVWSCPFRGSLLPPIKSKIENLLRLRTAVKSGL
jgi:hypothetical protein